MAHWWIVGWIEAHPGDTFVPTLIIKTQEPGQKATTRDNFQTSIADHPRGQSGNPNTLALSTHPRGQEALVRGRKQGA